MFNTNTSENEEIDVEYSCTTGTAVECRKVRQLEHLSIDSLMLQTIDESDPEMSYVICSCNDKNDCHFDLAKITLGSIADSFAEGTLLS